MPEVPRLKSHLTEILAPTPPPLGLIDSWFILVSRCAYITERLTDALCLNAATCNVHAQFAAWENGNRIANIRTLAT